MDDLISREEILKLPQEKGYAINGYESYIRVSDIKHLSSVQPEHGDEASFWKKCAREYEDIIADLVAEQAKGIKLDSITITEEGITFKKSQSERKCGKWINDEHDMPRCSCCGYMPEYNRHIDDYYYSDWCPNCGADMRGGDEG